ncbi:MAG: prepilin-type N-terminal cleavage/methylation domain-containing protein [Chitinivibrionales bacterium]|nr:prepilin-type N-terminal cleavage/methylation domain-containing protein [Chitinivibrionales bacterium]MBD3358719.1 prepilin-type N-terminal cleavage/methylation domain-containing protein [Chitinivibrionales bacterium]
MCVQSKSRVLRCIANNRGLTLIEMIGVLAIIAILAAAISPRIFDAIRDSRITSFSNAVKAMQTALSQYYADMGTLYPLNNAGTPVADATGALLPDILVGVNTGPNQSTGLWGRCRAPYLDNFNAQNPPIGTTMSMPAVEARNGNANANNVTNYDLNNDGAGDFGNTNQIVSLELTGVSQREFDKLDNIFDDGIGSTDNERQARGKVKWRNRNGGTLRIYLAHR